VADSPAEALQAKLRLLGEEYVAQLPEKIRQIELAWDGFMQSQDSEELQALHRMAHGLAGSGATFGFAEFGGAARSLEQKLVELENQGSIASKEQCAAISSQIHALHQAIPATMQSNQ